MLKAKKAKRYSAWLLTLIMILSQLSFSSNTASAAENLALNKQITAGSYTQVYAAKNANDGNQDTYWEGAANAYPNWLRVDLGSVNTIGEVKLKLPAFWGSRTQKLSVQKSEDDVNYSTVVDTAVYTFNSGTNTIDIKFSGTAARYIKLNFTANSGATGGQVSEVEVYGVQDAPPTSTNSNPAAVTRPAFDQIAASSYDSQFGTELESSSEGGQDVAFIDNGDYIVFNNVDFGSGADTFQARVASAANGGAIEIRLDDPNGPLAGTCTVPGTGGWQNWVTRTASISSVSGKHNLYLKFTGGAGNIFNVNWFTFGAPTAPPAASRSAFDRIAASSYDSQSGTQLESSSEGGQDVAFIASGDYIAFNNVDFGNGAASFNARVASGVNGGSIEVHLDSLNGPLAGTCTVPGTGGWQNWVTRTASISSVTGKHNLYLKFTGGTGDLFNINWFTFSATASEPQNPPTPPTGGDVVGKVFAGYQGWFNAAGDGSPNNGWVHWSKNSNAPTPNNNVNFELYPDTREYSKLYQTNLANLGNGQPAKLFSSYDQETVNKHFEWMKTYNINGAALQRFGASTSDTPDGWRTNRDSVAVKVKNAAEKYDRKFYIMYDITDMNPSSWVQAVEHDWTTNIINNMQLTSSSAYAKQDGKPVVCIWGIGFTDRPGTAAESLSLIKWFQNQGYYVIGGVPTYWRDGDTKSDTKQGFLDVYKSLDMLSPWFVGRFGGLDGVDFFNTWRYGPDFAFTQQYGIDYQPVIWPGSAWSNLTGNNKRNENPRLHGDFMWRQAYDLKKLGVNTGYIAMFDEYDEGTAIAKIAEDSSMIPANQYFLTLDADGVHVSSDFYLRLAGDINRLFNNEVPLTENHPTSHQ